MLLPILTCFVVRSLDRALFFRLEVIVTGGRTTLLLLFPPFLSKLNLSMSSTTSSLISNQRWQKEKVLAAQLLSICTGRSLLDELPGMLEFWVLESTRDEDVAAQSQVASTLAFTLLKKLATTCPFHFGNDIKVMAALPGVLRDACNVPEGTLKTQYEACMRRLPMLRGAETPTFFGDVFEVDQLLIPALLGGSTPLTSNHAREVRKHVLRDDDTAAMKLVAMYSMKDDLHFSARLPGAFLLPALKQRLVEAVSTHENSKFLYAAMKGMGCIGPLSNDEDGEGEGDGVSRHGTAPAGFKARQACDGMSLALRYAQDLDEDLESLSIFKP